MLIEFTTENFLSFKDSHTLSLVAGKGKEFPEHIIYHQPPQAVRAKPVPVLKSSAIYGANAGGKTNLLKAMAFMRFWVLQSSKESQASEPIPLTSFLLSPACRDEPSSFEVVFVHNRVRYRYGFSADTERVHMEWLFAAPKGREAKYFIRDNGAFEFGSGFGRPHSLVEKTRENALFLSVAAQFNHGLSKDLLRWFADWQIYAADTGPLPRHSFDRVTSKEKRERLVQFLQLADDSISDLGVEEVDLHDANLPKGIRERIARDLEKSKENGRSLQVGKLVSYHYMYDEAGAQLEQVPFDFENESKGTRKFFDLAGCILFALDHGIPLVVDELECSLHPKMTRFILDLFHNPETNTKNAQLIFATHDLVLFNRHFFRRDQLWMVRKNEFGASELYALSDFQVRPDSSYDKDYMEGRYGAIPVLVEPAAIYRSGGGSSEQEYDKE